MFVFGVDLDGVCADYTAGFRRIAADLLNVPESSLPLERSWHFDEWGFGPGKFEEAHRAAVIDYRMFRDLPMIDGAADALWRLSDAGVWIRIITHRLYVNWGHAIAVADTVAWLDNARIPYRDICFLGMKPEVEADIYIDDAPHNIYALREHGNEAIVFDQPYNRGLPAPRASSWTEAEALVFECAAKRGVELQPQLPGIDAGADRLDRRRPTG